jgi:uncharacterized protein
MAPFDAINKTPGVYIQEIDVPGPIAGVGTSTAAFIGPAEQGPINTPVFLTNWTQFQNLFGGYITAPPVYVTHAIRGFLDNGGASFYFVRVSKAVRAALTLNDRASPAKPVLVVTAKQEGVQGTDLQVEVRDATLSSTTVRGDSLARNATVIPVESVAGIEANAMVQISQGTTTETKKVQAVNATDRSITLTTGVQQEYTIATDNPVRIQTPGFTLVVTAADGTETAFENLSMDSQHSRYFSKPLDSKLVDVTLAEPPNATLPPQNRPAVLAKTKLNAPAGRSDDLSQLAAADYSAAIATLERIDDVNLLCIPDRSDQDVQKAMIAHCEKMQDRFAILDPGYGLPPDATASTGIGQQRSGIGSDGGYAALYYPWIEITNPVGAGRIAVPPSGHLAGVYARTDGTRGVFKAPANETIRGAIALEQRLTDDEQGPLNEQGINVLRSVAGRGVVVWGARTLSSKTQWRYINVRRLMLFIEESIQEGTQFAVFEPNGLELWQKVKRQVTEFLTRVWNDGALFGATAKQAFQVRVDEELNPPDLRALGQLVIEVVVYPVTPAEFIVFRIIQQPGGPSVQE